MKKAIIIGASSGIGAALAKELSNSGYVVGITARRIQRLTELKEEMKGEVFIEKMDIADVVTSRDKLKHLIKRMGGLDLLVLNAGIGYGKPTWEEEMQIIDVNTKGFVALANYAFDLFMEQRSGHIVGVSSIASIRGTRVFTVYSATKAFMANYLQGLAFRSWRKGNKVAITEIRPGYVATEMTEKNDGMFWVSQADEAASYILKAIRKKKSVAYITPRWALIGFIYRYMPKTLYYRFT